MKVPTLKPRLALASGRAIALPAAPVHPDAVPRQRGGGWMRRRAAWLYGHPLCIECERAHLVTAGQEVDHVTPLWAGGADTDGNLQTLCAPHHADKSRREYRLWVEFVQGKIDRAQLAQALQH